MVRASLVLYVVLALGLGCGPRGEPVLVAPGLVTVMTFNTASGGGDRFRTPDNRARQGALVARSAAEVVGLQEVDVGVERSGDTDTAAAVAAAVAPGFASCSFAVGGAPHMRSDGTRLRNCEAGSVVFGVAFRADDAFAASSDGTPSGIMDADDSLNPPSVDRSADAFYGNALIVRAPWEVEASYTVALPIDAAGPAAPDELLERLREGPSEDAVEALAAHNVATRRQRGIEPRSVLVVRIRKPGTTALTLLTTHLESSGPRELRRAQLAALVAIARAEQSRRGTHHVVVMGDFNMPPSEAEPRMAGAGFVRAAPPDATPDIHQIWVEPLVVATAARVPTDGASDHEAAVIATLR